MQCGYLHGSPNKLFHSTWFIDVFLLNRLVQPHIHNVSTYLASHLIPTTFVDLTGIVSTLDWKWFSVTAIFGSEGTGGMVIEWDVSSCSSNRVICSLQIVCYRSYGHTFVTCILILHSLSEHLYPGTQLVNLPQLTDSLITIK